MKKRPGMAHLKKLPICLNDQQKDMNNRIVPAVNQL